MHNKNSMGSDVKEGYKCKPLVLDENKPVMFSAMQIFICDGERCNTKDNVKEKIVIVIKEMGLDKGKNRVKVTRTFCNGACRYRKFAYIYKKTSPLNYTAWKKVHTWTDEQWAYIISSLLDDKEPIQLNDFRVEDKVYDENEKSHK